MSDSALEGNVRAVRAVYRQPSSPLYTGNRLIDCLPMIETDKDFRKSFSGSPQIKVLPEDAGLVQRKLAILLLDEFHNAEPGHLRLTNSLNDLIRSGYYAQSSHLQLSQAEHQGRYEQSMAGSVAPLTGKRRIARGHCVFAEPGVGKSSTIERFLSSVPQRIVHPDFAEHHVPWVKVECPADGSIKSLLVSLLTQIDWVLGSSYSLQLPMRKTAQMAIPAIANVFAKHRVGLIIFDEIQNISSSSQGRDVALNYFVQYANEIKIPFVCIGTNSAKSILTSPLHKSRRLSGFGVTTWGRMSPERGWDGFIKALWEYQYTPSRCELSNEISLAIYQMTAGIHGIAVMLFQLSQLLALDSRAKSISLEMISDCAAQNFQLIQPVISAMLAGEEIGSRGEKTLQNQLNVTRGRIKEHRRDVTEAKGEKDFGPMFLGVDDSTPKSIGDIYNAADRTGNSGTEALKATGYLKEE